MFNFLNLSPMSKIVCDKPTDFLSEQYKLIAIQVYDPEVGYLMPDLTNLKVNHIVLKNFKICDVRIKKTPEEKAEKRRHYRREYMKKPKTIEKLKARLLDPVIAKQRKEYAMSPEVMERKRQSAKKQRAIGRILKHEKPEIYRTLVEKAEKLLSDLSSNAELDSGCCAGAAEF